MLLSIPFPNIDPVLVSFGPIVIRWYALAYIAGLLIGWRYLIGLAGAKPQVMEVADADDFLVWATLGVILGGRLGYVLFYQPGFFLDHPDQVLAIWKGGMSFHGGFLGVVVAGIVFVKRRGIDALQFADRLSCVAPVGLFFGRIANFINAELYGRISDVPWAVVFPGGGPEGRHPSQLYEAALEGALLFAIVNLVWWRTGARHRPGRATGVFIAGYAVARAFVELFRQPDAHIGFLSLGSTMGQWLSLPMLVVGLYLIFRAKPEAGR